MGSSLRAGPFQGELGGGEKGVLACCQGPLLRELGKQLEKRGKWRF